MHRPNDYRLLQEKVQDWLLNEQTEYIVDARTKNKKIIDFLVIKPFPLAIELKTDISNHALKRMSKRMLTMRIDLSETYGPYLFFIVITNCSLDNLEQMSFVDGTFSIEKLPSLPNLKGKISVNDDVMKILKKGEPRSFSYLSKKEIEEYWENSLSYENLIQYMNRQEGVSPCSNRSRDILVENKNIWGEAQNIHSFKIEQNKRLSNNNLKPYLIKAFTEKVENKVKFSIGGAFGKCKIESFQNKNRPLLVMPVWESPNGKKFIVQIRAFSELSKMNRISELQAEAWICRALGDFQSDRLILLLGNWNVENSISISETPVTKDSFLNVITKLESAGWNVFPWDLESDEPRFISYLKEKRDL